MNIIIAFLFLDLRFFSAIESELDNMHCMVLYKSSAVYSKLFTHRDQDETRQEKQKFSRLSDVIKNLSQKLKTQNNLIY